MRPDCINKLDLSGPSTLLKALLKGKGAEIWLRTVCGCLPVHGLWANRFQGHQEGEGYSRHGCPCCDAKVESIAHFVLACPKYHDLRMQFFRVVHSDLMGALVMRKASVWRISDSATGDEARAKLYQFLSCDWPDANTADGAIRWEVLNAMVMFLYAAWMRRLSVKFGFEDNVPASEGRVADGSNAMA